MLTRSPQDTLLILLRGFAISKLAPQKTLADIWRDSESLLLCYFPLRLTCIHPIVLWLQFTQRCSLAGLPCTAAQVAKARRFSPATSTAVIVRAQF